MHKEKDRKDETLEGSTTNSTTDSVSSNENMAAAMFGLELELIKTLQQPSIQEIQRRWVFLGPQTKKVTLVLDLDETLIAARSSATTLSDPANDILLRPYSKQLLARISSTYEIVVFTAANEEYAMRAMGLLDPEKLYVKELLTRPQCLPLSNGGWVKDLRIFADRDLEGILIVDNSIISFAFQLANGIPVSAFKGDPEDHELMFLADYLESLAPEANIVKLNEAYIGLTALFN